MTLHYIYWYSLLLVWRIEGRTLGQVVLDPPQYSTQKEWRSRAFSLKELGEGSVENEPQVEDENLPTLGAQELKPQQTVEVEAVVEQKPDSEQGI